MRLTVDGEPRTLHTFADDIDELLDDEGIAVGAHDVVTPAPVGDLDDGDEITVRHGRPMTLTLDGVQRRVWTTAGSVDGALRQLGVRAEGRTSPSPAPPRSAAPGSPWTSVPNAP